VVGPILAGYQRGWGRAGLWGPPMTCVGCVFRQDVRQDEWGEAHWELMRAENSGSLLISQRVKEWQTWKDNQEAGLSRFDHVRSYSTARETFFRKE
jgi:hypothetical protein